MGNRAMVGWVVGGLLVVSAGFGVPSAVSAETHTRTIQVLIHIPERRPQAEPVIQTASLTREQAIASAISAHTAAPAPSRLSSRR